VLDVRPVHAADALLEGLNERQREAVVHPGGPILVVAGAGSGKTRVLTHRIAYLVHERGVKPHEILAITFTNRAASEMRERVERLIGGTRGMWVLTFHAACGRILRREAERLGYRSNFTIYDDGDQQRLVKACLESLERDPKRFPPRGIHSQISSAKNRLVSAAAFREQVGNFFEQVVADVYELYERRLHAANAMDFDDMLVRTVDLLEQFPDVRERWQTAFKHLLVDEYQDTNHAQYQIVKLLSGKHRNVFVVGDADQCLLEGTAVTMADGSTRPIETIAVGDEVLSCYGSGDFRPAAVSAVHRAKRRQGIAITTRGGRRVVSSPEHWHFAGYRLGVTPQLSMASAMRRRSVARQGVLGAALVAGTAAIDPGFADWASDEDDRVTVTMCDERGGESPVHRVSMVGRDAQSAEALRELGLPVRNASADGSSWRLEASSDDLGRIMYVARQIERSLGASVRCEGRLGGTTAIVGGSDALPCTPASAVRAGMAMFDQDGGYDVVQRVQRVGLDQPLYDLDVAGTHNFVANGLVTHNSVYGWRGADIRNILDFEHDYPDAAVIKLEQNYRSTQTILDAANAVIQHNSDRLEKRLWSELGTGEPIRIVELEDEHAEARLVAARIGALLEEGMSARDVAVFYRTNAQSRVLEDILVRHGVPYQVIGGPKFYDRAEVRDAMAYMHAIDNPTDDLSLRRIVNTPKRAIGNTTIDRLAAHAAAFQASLWEAIDTFEEAGLGTAAERAVGGFRTLMRRLRERVADPAIGVGDAVEAVITEAGLIEAYEAERTIEAQGRIENLQELIGVAREYEARAEEPSLTGFLQEISLVADADAVDQERGKVTLMTLHNAKGLEFDAVFVMGMEQNLFPHIRSIEEANLEEERRLCYVAITRARKQLTITYTRQRTLFGARGMNLPSQFLDEIPAALAEHERAARQPGYGGGYGSQQGSGWGSSSATQRGWGARQGGGGGSGFGAPSAPPQTVRAPREDVPDLAVGDNVRHEQLGEGIVIGVDRGGQVVVRFEADGSERRLLLAYAPLARV
jgi:DNA helicase-2/ATP-dependent DNA helicase PcrA